MSDFAFKEIYSLTNHLNSTNDDTKRESTLRYICALFAELAYYHIPEWEIDAWKRVKVVPADALHQLSGMRAAFGKGGTNLNSGSMREIELSQGFEVSTEGCVAVGRIVDEDLYIGVRGTKFLHDWKIDFSSKLIPVSLRLEPFFCGTKLIHLHKGFAYEASRILPLINNAIKNEGITFKNLYLTGHSLGGAIAAILAELMREKEPKTVTFGAPRHSDLSAYFDYDLSRLPTHVRIQGDIVPHVPPRSHGYIDPLRVVLPCGKEYFDPSIFSGFMGDWVRAACFAFRLGKPHFMEHYRRQVGIATGAKGAKLPLLDVSKIEFNDLNS